MVEEKSFGAREPAVGDSIVPVDREMFAGQPDRGPAGVVSFRRLGVLKDTEERIARGRPITEGQELHSPVEFGVPRLAAHAGILPRVRRCWEGVDGSQAAERLQPLIGEPVHADEGGVKASHVPEERPSISAPSPDRKDDHRDRAAYESSLVASAADGDVDAFEELYRTHVGGVARHVRLRLGKADEDAVAEVFVRAWAGISSYRDVGRPFGAWLFGIARHVIADEFRARSRTFPVAEPPERAVEPMTAELLALREAIDRLPEDQRQVIELRYLAGLTNDEVAAAMEATPSAVNTKRWRALLVLRDVLKDEP